MLDSESAKEQEKPFGEEEGHVINLDEDPSPDGREQEEGKVVQDVFISYSSNNENIILKGGDEEREKENSRSHVSLPTPPTEKLMKKRERSHFST